MQQEPPGFTQSQNYNILNNNNNNGNFIDSTTTTATTTTAITTQLTALNLNNSENHEYTNGDNGLLLTPVQYLPPPRTTLGTEGKTIRLHANHFIMNVPKGFLYQYNVTITPEKCPKRINRYV
jgi:hypothetical protein